MARPHPRIGGAARPEIAKNPTTGATVCQNHLNGAPARLALTRWPWRVRTAPAIHAQASRTPHSELTVREPRLGAITTRLGVHITLTHYSSHKQPCLGAITTSLGVPASKPQKSHQQSPTPRRLTPTPSMGDTSSIP
ncbi:hypothetical protein PIB30_083899, partial [Stylosanthes scabra]|nr:hypothetical protein [Stylosanthes scabra]